MSSDFSISSMFPSRYLKPSDIGEVDLVLTIEAITIEDIGRSDHKDSKVLVHFKETEKALVLNKTNALTIAHLYGEQTGGWVGKRISLYITEVSFQGTPMLGIRIRMRVPSPQQKPDKALPESQEQPDIRA
jgi:hypothetical protein